MDLNLNDLWNAGGILIILSMIIQIAPIKLNPWSKILRGIGHLLNGEISDKLDETVADNSRYRILRFNDELHHNQNHTKEHFEQLLDDIDKYEKYCAAHPDYKNGRAVEAIKNIRETYRDCTYNKSFL